MQFIYLFIFQQSFADWLMGSLLKKTLEIFFHRISH